MGFNKEKNRLVYRCCLYHSVRSISGFRTLIGSFGLNHLGVLRVREEQDPSTRDLQELDRIILEDLSRSTPDKRKMSEDL